MTGVVSTGLPALDTFLRGGLPKGFTTLLLAPVGAGGEILAKQFCLGPRGERVLYLTTDESTEEVAWTAKTAEWDFSAVQVVDIQTDFAAAVMEAQEKRLERTQTQPAITFDPRDLVENTSSTDILRKAGARPTASETPGTHDYLARLLEPFRRLRGPDRMVVHSLDFFLNMYPADQVLSTLTALKAANARHGGLLMLVLAKGAHGASTERGIELLADCLIELEVSRKGTTFERFFMVKKVKNRTTGVGVSTYHITPQGFQLETLERIV
jgi:KaiC/GvpD/RAD55 family RecA-like ATPase